MMYYLSEYIRKANNSVTEGLIEYKKAKEIWALPERSKYRTPLLPAYMKFDGYLLRETTPIPFLMEHEIKQGFYSLEFVF